MSDPADLDATAAIALIRAGTLRSTELVRACLARLEMLEERVHAWVYVDPERVLARAAEIDALIATGERLGALPGIPIGIKDIFNTHEMPNQMGSPIWSGFTPGNDARVVHYLRMAGGVLLGKTVTAEFAVHTPGPTRNPHDLDHMPGTSSSGSAAAVACGMVPLALGTQTAGSTIRPASYCGVYGMKPSFGLIPRTGMLKTTDSLDTVGLFARSPRDLRLALDVMRVHGRDYPLSEAALADPRRQDKGDRPWRVAVVEGPTWQHAEPYAQDALHRFAQRLGGVSGMSIEELRLPDEFARAHGIHSTIYDFTLAYYFQEEFKKGTLISELMYAIIDRGNRISPERYVEALDQQDDLAARFDELMRSVDVIITLSTGGEALRGLNSPDRPDSCLMWTLCGAPAVSAPLFVGPNGLPFGLQVVARRYNDPLLLSFVDDLLRIGSAPVGTHPSLRLTSFAR